MKMSEGPLRSDLSHKSVNHLRRNIICRLMLFGLCTWLIYPLAAQSFSPEYGAPPSPTHAVARYAVLSTSDAKDRALILRAPSDLNWLGIQYAKGQGVKRDAGSAKRLFLRSAMLGYTPAMANLGTLYQIGATGRPNFYRAYAWVRAALSFGVPEEDHDATVMKLGMIAARLGPEQINGAERLAGTLATRIVDTCTCSPGRETELASNGTP